MGLMMRISFSIWQPCRFFQTSLNILLSSSGWSFFLSLPAGGGLWRVPPGVRCRCAALRRNTLSSVIEASRSAGDDYVWGGEGTAASPRSFQPQKEEMWSVSIKPLPPSPSLFWELRCSSLRPVSPQTSLALKWKSCLWFYLTESREIHPCVSCWAARQSKVS